ncbi:MAG TPA: hypothetical protein VGA38_11680 [Candidatus Limnocylindria bacterium]
MADTEPEGLTDEQWERINSAIREKVKIKPCPLCGSTEERVLINGIVPIPVQLSLAVKDPDGAPVIGLGRAERNLPSVALICQTCGDTSLLNAYALGLSDLVGPSTSAKQKAEEAKKSASVPTETQASHG